MNKEENKKIVSDFFERFTAFDVEGALDLLVDSVVWRAMGREGGLPMSGEMDRHSIGELMETLRLHFPME